MGKMGVNASGVYVNSGKLYVKEAGRECVGKQHITSSPLDLPFG